jgi:hypothetical protein
MTPRRPSGFIEPCQPSKAARPPSGPLWVHEIKHDGYRLMVLPFASGAGRSATQSECGTEPQIFIFRKRTYSRFHYLAMVAWGRSTGSENDEADAVSSSTARLLS